MLSVIIKCLLRDNRPTTERGNKKTPLNKYHYFRYSSTFFPKKKFQGLFPTKFAATTANFIIPTFVVQK